MAVILSVVCDVCGDTGWRGEVDPVKPAASYAAAEMARLELLEGGRWGIQSGKLCCSIRCRSDAWEPPTDAET